MDRTNSIEFFSIILFFCAIAIAQVATLKCYTCEFSYEMIDNKPDSWCADKNLIADKYKDHIQTCAVWENYCFIQIKAVNQAFTSIVRGCANDKTGARICTSQGFGIDMVVCTNFCQSDQCNDDYKVAFYQELMQSRLASWKKVLKDEQKYNDKANIRLDL